MTSKQLEKLAKTIIGSDTATKAAPTATPKATPTATSTIAKSTLPTPKTVNNTSASSTTASNLPPIASKLSPVVSLTPIKVESPTTAIPHGPITGQKRKLSEKSSNETPTLAKKKKEIHQKQAAVSQQQQQQQQQQQAAANAISELLVSSGIQMPGINQNTGLNLQNAAVLQEIARQITQQKITQQNKKSPSSKKGIAAAI